MESVFFLWSAYDIVDTKSAEQQQLVLQERESKSKSNRDIAVACVSSQAPEYSQCRQASLPYSVCITEKQCLYHTHHTTVEKEFLHPRNRRWLKPPAWRHVAAKAMSRDLFRTARDGSSLGSPGKPYEYCPALNADGGQWTYTLGVQHTL